jgi:hypothetical protein
MRSGTFTWLAAAALALLVALPARASTPAGLKIFRDAGCGSCHTLAAAGASGNVGPDLDSAPPTTAAVAAQVKSGGGGMPSFSGTLSSAQIATLAGWVSSVAGQSSSTTPSRTTPPPAGLVQKHTRADTAAAGKVSLTLADVGSGWTDSNSTSAEPALTCASSHPDLSGIVETGAAASSNLQAGSHGPFVSEFAWVYKTAAQASLLWQRAVGPQLLGCLAASITQGSTNQIRFKVRSKHALAAPSGALLRAAYRVVATAATSGQTSTVYYDLVVLGGSRGVAEITFARIGAPMTRSIESKLATAVAKRLAAIPAK